MSLPPVPKNWHWAKGTPAGGLHAWLGQLRGRVNAWMPFMEDADQRLEDLESLSGTYGTVKAVNGTAPDAQGNVFIATGPTTATYHPTPAKPQTALKAATDSRYADRMDYRHNYGRLWNRNSGGLRYSDDEGVTWNVSHTFDKPVLGSHQLENGEMIVSTWHTADVPGDLWLSSGLLANPQAATWTKVLTARAPAVSIHGAWGMSSWRNVVLVSEYGAKSATGGANNVYLSTDHGQTWTVVLVIAGEGLHVHGSAVDPYHMNPAGPRLWACHGDASEAILWSDDLGKSWSTVPGEYTQMVGIIPLPNGVLFTTDGYTNGVWRSRRTGGPIPEPPEVAYAIDNVQAITVLGGQHQLPARTGAPALLPFFSSAFEQSAQGKAQGRLLMTLDGETFHEVFTDTVDLGHSTGLLAAYGPLPSGKYGGLLTSGGRVDTPYADLRVNAPAWSLTTTDLGQATNPNGSVTLTSRTGAVTATTNPNGSVTLTSGA